MLPPTVLRHEMSPDRAPKSPGHPLNPSTLLDPDRWYCPWTPPLYPYHSTHWSFWGSLDPYFRSLDYKESESEMTPRSSFRESLSPTPQECYEEYELVDQSVPPYPPAELSSSSSNEAVAPASPLLHYDYSQFQDDLRKTVEVLQIPLEECMTLPTNFWTYKPYQNSASDQLGHITTCQGGLA